MCINMQINRKSWFYSKKKFANYKKWFIYNSLDSNGKNGMCPCAHQRQIIAILWRGGVDTKVGYKNVRVSLTSTKTIWKIFWSTFLLLFSNFHTYWTCLAGRCSKQAKDAGFLPFPSFLFYFSHSLPTLLFQNLEKKTCLISHSILIKSIY